MRLYIIRHADPDYENNTITPQGHIEAKALAKRMHKEGIDKIYSSPMGRALDTMKYTSEILEIEPNIEEWTKEHSDIYIELKDNKRIFGLNLHGEYIREDLSLLNYEDWHKLSYFKDIDIKDIFQNVVKGSDEFIKRHGYERVGGKYRCINPTNEKIAIFCHGGFGLTWLSHLLEIPLPLMWSGFWLPTSSVTTVLFDRRTPNWAVPRCIGLADTSHLYADGLEVLPRGIVQNYY